jgi:hypothetical protein
MNTIGSYCEHHKDESDDYSPAFCYVISENSDIPVRGIQLWGIPYVFCDIGSEWTDCDIYS